MNTSALAELLPEGVLLSTLPFILYCLYTRPDPPSRALGCVKGVVAGVCVLGFLVVFALYFVLWFGSGMSGGGAGAYPLERLLQMPHEAALRILVFSALAVGLARAQKGTLGLWVFAIGAGYIAYWAGLGWLPLAQDWQVVLAFAASAGLGGMLAGFLLSWIRPPPQRVRHVLLWSGVGAGAAALGMLVSGPAVQRAMRPWRTEPIELTPFAVDPWVMVPLLVTGVVMWLALSTGAALATGYLKLGSSGSEPLPATES